MLSRKIMLMQGNEACVEGALAAGMRFFAGYPITPSTEIAEIAAERLPKVGGKFIQMEDELASMGAVVGASLAGLKAMTATSGPGFSLKQENIGFACLTEVPCVVVNVQRGGPSTGLPTLPAQGDVMQTRWGTHGDHPIIVISPSSVREVYDMTIRAFNLSEKYRVPCILLMDEVVAHMRERVELPDKSSIDIINRKKVASPTLLII
jgi:2-oxoglutarate ferredoxin oxidoreductase subunit alpha